MTHEEQIARVKELLGEITPGEWRKYPHPSTRHQPYLVMADGVEPYAQGDHLEHEVAVSFGMGKRKELDAEFIALARNLMPALLLQLDDRESLLAYISVHDRAEKELESQLIAARQEIERLQGELQLARRDEQIAIEERNYARRDTPAGRCGCQRLRNDGYHYPTCALSNDTSDAPAP